MEIITKAELSVRQQEILSRIFNGEIFIHPTDTIYGLGCNATDDEAVKKVRRIKENPNQPFAIWAPNKKWIQENCEITKEAQDWIDKLPGPYMLILKLKKKKAISKHVNPKGDTIGVRIPDHWFAQAVQAMNIPIVTTAVNKLGNEYMTSEDDLNRDIKNNTRLCIYEGEKRGKPSKVVQLA